MKKLLTILFLLLFYSCQKPDIIVQYIPNAFTYLKYINLVADTTLQVNGVWDGEWKVFNPVDAQGNIHHVYGAGTMINWILNIPYTADVFDTSINLVNIKVAGEAFSAMWYGAKSSNPDNWWNIQKSINVCINNFPLYIPKGHYKLTRSLTASYIYAGEYAACKLDMYGDGDIWDNSTTLSSTGGWFAFGIQRAKGGSIHNIKFEGVFVSPTNNGMQYYNLSDADFKDQSGRSGRNYSGIVIDYDRNLNAGGSTGLKIYDVWVDGFDVLYNISPNGATFNADIISFRDIRCGNGRIGFQSGQAQEKGNTITNVVAWENLHTLIDIGNSGKFQAGSYTVTGGNIAGGVIRLFNVRLSGWNPFAVNGLTAESIATIGTVTTGDFVYTPTATLNDLRVSFALPEDVGNQILFTANSVNVKISNSILWYYGRPNETLHFSGLATMENNNYSGAVKWN